MENFKSQKEREKITMELRFKELTIKKLLNYEVCVLYPLNFNSY
jgi:hypothetical protein